MSLAAENNCSVTKGGALVRDRKHRAGSSFLPALLLLKLHMRFLQAEISRCSSLLERQIYIHWYTVMEFTRSGGIGASFSTVAVESGIVLVSFLATASPAAGA